MRACVLYIVRFHNREPEKSTKIVLRQLRQMCNEFSNVLLPETELLLSKCVCGPVRIVQTLPVCCRNGIYMHARITKPISDAKFLETRCYRSLNGREDRKQGGSFMGA